MYKNNTKHQEKLNRGPGDNIDKFEDLLTQALKLSNLF